MSKKIVEISETLYNTIGSVNKHNTIGNELDLIQSEMDKIKFVEYNVKLYDSNYLIGLLLTFPKLWIDFTMSHWKQIVYNSFPRKHIDNSFKMISEDQGYGDLIFIHKILSLNPIFFILNNNKGFNEEVVNALNFLIKYDHKLFILREDLAEICNDYYNVSIFDIEEYSNKLIRSGCDRKFDTPEALEKKIKEILDSGIFH